MTLYETLADEMDRGMAQGALKAGDRLPSIRESARARSLSITTVRQAYTLLESRGSIESRPGSGFFVRVREAVPTPAPRTPEPSQVAAEVDISLMVLGTLKRIRQSQSSPLGSPYPDPSLFPWTRIQRYSQAIARRFQAWNVVDDIPPGHPELIRQIARRHLANGLRVDPAEVVVTVGATEAINLCLQAVARPGDTIAVESPTYYAMLMAIERMGMRAVEVPTDAETGIDVEALARLIDHQRIDACLCMPNFQNPAGFTMPEPRKRELVRLTARHGIPIVENGVYNELHHGEGPPGTLKSCDEQGLVLHCSSFTKSVTAGARIGWALPGRYREQVERLKFLNTLATPAIPQLALAEYLARGGMDRHLRGVRRTLAQRAGIMRSMVARHFPPGTRVSQPHGGYLLWVELPAPADTVALYRRALERGITIAPGRVFSNADLYGRFLRINFSYPWSRELEAAVRELGVMAAHA